MTTLDAVKAGYLENMTTLIGEVVSVHAGDNENLSKDEHGSIQVELDGIVGDKHRGYVRSCYSVDKQPAGSARRNERQWSAISIEELKEIAANMGSQTSITPASIGANICVRGIPQLSRLPKGTLLKFSSGAELIVEEYNPPCKDMSAIQAELHNTSNTAFSKAAKLKRGVVGVVEAAGKIKTGDDVTVIIYETPRWLVRSG